MAAEATRRDALVRGIAAGGALAAGSAAGLATAGRATAQERTVIDLLVRAAALEQDARVAYEELAAGDVLDEEVAAAAELFAGQQREHVEALEAALEDLGTDAPPPPRPAQVEGLEDAGAQEEALRLLLDLENALIRAYGELVAAPAGKEILKTATQIALNAAQHVVVLRQQLGEPALPEDVETGEPGV
jgi:rubrerythrin